MMEQLWTAADSTMIPENRLYEGLPILSFTENLKNKHVKLKPSLVEPRAITGTVRAVRVFTTDESVVDLYEDQQVVTLQPSGFEYKPASLLERLDGIVSLLVERPWHMKQNLFLNAEVSTISRVEFLGPRQPCLYRPVAKTFVAHGFLGRFNG